MYLLSQQLGPMGLSSAPYFTDNNVNPQRPTLPTEVTSHTISLVVAKKHLQEPFRLSRNLERREVEKNSATEILSLLYLPGPLRIQTL